jgi:hypothetical protein
VKVPVTTTSPFEKGGSDSSLADGDNEDECRNENLRNGNGLHGGYLFEVDGMGKEDEGISVAMTDGDDDDDYVIRTDHLVRAGDAP